MNPRLDFMQAVPDGIAVTDKAISDIVHSGLSKKYCGMHIILFYQSADGQSIEMIAEEVGCMVPGMLAQALNASQKVVLDAMFGAQEGLPPGLPGIGGPGDDHK